MFWIFLLSGFAAAAVASAAPTSILIDPGHGGRDHGTVRQQTREADITLNVARKLYTRLSQDKGFQVRMTRDTDKGVGLGERAKLARDNRADLFLSIHVNSSPDPRAEGVEIYFQNQLPPDEESMFLAHQENADSGATQPRVYDFVARSKYPAEVAAIITDLLDGDRILRSSQLSKSLKMSWRGTRVSKASSVRQAPFYVLSQMTAPSALVELGFLTHPDDFRDLTDANVQAKMADDLYRGLLQYRESITNGNAPR